MKICAGCVESQVSRMRGLLVLVPVLDRHRLVSSLDTIWPSALRLNHWPGLLEQPHISTYCPRVGVHPLTVQHMAELLAIFTATVLTPENSWLVAPEQVCISRLTPLGFVMHCCCPLAAVCVYIAGPLAQGAAASSTGGGGAGGHCAVKICEACVMSQVARTSGVAGSVPVADTQKLLPTDSIWPSELKANVWLGCLLQENISTTAPAAWLQPAMVRHQFDEMAVESTCTASVFMPLKSWSVLPAQSASDRA